MRILFRDACDRLVHTVFAFGFFAEFEENGEFVVSIRGSGVNLWTCRTMSYDEFDEYAYHLAVNGFIDLRAFCFTFENED